MFNFDFNTKLLNNNKFGIGCEKFLIKLMGCEIGFFFSVVGILIRIILLLIYLTIISCNCIIYYIGVRKVYEIVLYIIFFSLLN